MHTHIHTYIDTYMHKFIHIYVFFASVLLRDSVFFVGQTSNKQANKKQTYKHSSDATQHHLNNLLKTHKQQTNKNTHTSTQKHRKKIHFILSIQPKIPAFTYHKKMHHTPG